MKKLVLFSLVTFMNLGFANELLSTNQIISQLKIPVGGEVLINYFATPKITDISVERVPTDFDPDISTHEYYCLTRVAFNLGTVSIRASVKDDVKELENLNYEAVALNETPDDGKCSEPKFTNVPLDLIPSIYPNGLSFKNSRLGKEFVLALNASGGKEGQVVLTKDESVRVINRPVGFDMSWALYYSTGVDDRMILREQGTISLK